MDLTIIQSWIQARLKVNERGASMVEYALLVALIAIVAIVALRLLGGDVSTKFSDIASGIKN